MPNTPDSLPRRTQRHTPTQIGTRGAPGAHVPAVASEQLFRGAAELHINHGGVMYRLRQTSLGKLILTA